jgi:hypothetical protein
MNVTNFEVIGIRGIAGLGCKIFFDNNCSFLVEYESFRRKLWHVRMVKITTINNLLIALLQGNGLSREDLRHLIIIMRTKFTISHLSHKASV